MPLRRVEQKHDFGCFVAAVASLMNTSYDHAANVLGIVNPDRGIPVDDALTRLHRIGFRFKPTKKRKIRTLRKRAMILVTWDNGLGHTILWDPERKRIIDPAAKRPWTIPSYERYLHRIIYV